MNSLAKIASYLLLIVADILIRIYKGLVISWLWLWFMVPLGLQPIGVVLAIGIALCVGFLTKNTHVYTTFDADPNLKERPMHKALAMQFSSVAYITAVWGMGYIIHLFM